MLKIIEQKHQIKEADKYLCTVVDISDADINEFDIIIHIDEINLIKALNNLQQAANLYPPVMNDLWQKIKTYAKK